MHSIFHYKYGILALTLVSLISISYLYADEFEESVFPWIKENSLTIASHLGEFRPDDSITRGEAAKFIVNYASLLGLEKGDSECSFTDLGGYDPSLTPFIREACQYGIFRGNNGRFSPKNNITEAEAIAVIIRSLEGVSDESENPWYRAYYARAVELDILDDESEKSLEKTLITREKLATWLYRAYYSDATEDVIIYETDVEGPDDCSSYEKYDEKRNVCSYECIDEAECKNIQTEIDRELEGWSEDLDGVERTAPQDAGSPTEGTIVMYEVTKGEKITRISGKTTPEYEALWKEVADLSPDSLSDIYIENFEIYNDASSDVIAFVEDDDGNGKWKMAVNLSVHKGSDIREQKSTLIHELAHIITLNQDQFTNPTGACPNYETDEGCTKSSSHLHAFEKKFWKGKKSAEYSDKNFVSEYATTNPEEDIAESFAFYILESNFSNTNVKEQKLNFFNTYPELIEMRKSMRNVLASDIIRAKKSK